MPVDLLIADDALGGMQHAPRGGFRRASALLRDDGLVGADEALVAARRAGPLLGRILQVRRIGGGQLGGGVDLLIFRLLARGYDGQEVSHELLGTWHAILLDAR